MRTTLLLPFLLAAACGKERSEAPAGVPDRQTSRAPLSEALLHPERATEKAPEKFRVRFETTKGAFVIEATRAWAPNGVDRLYNLVRIGYYNDVAFFRVLKGFVAQFGMHGEPKVMQRWASETIGDDPVAQSNRRGMVTFAAGQAPNTRSVQLFVNLADNPELDRMGFAPIAVVVEGMEVVDRLHGVPRNREDLVPNQQLIAMGGNIYLRQDYPRLDYVRSAAIEPG